MRLAVLSAPACLTPVLILAASCGPAEAPPSREATMQTTFSDAETVLSLQSERTGSGRPVVLIGGGLTGWTSWQPHAERLAATREVVRLQLLGVQYGLEDRPLPEGYSVRTESRAMAAALDALELEQPLDFVAWSYGAAVTLDFALDHPGRVRTLTLIEPPALWVLPDHGRALADVRELEALATDLKEDIDVAALERFVRTVALVPPGAAPEALPQWESWVRHRRSLRTSDAVFRHAEDPARIAALTAPVLLTTGAGTSPFLRAVHDRLAEALPNARMLELPGGHAPHLVAMDDFLAQLEAFHTSPHGADHGERHTVTSRDGTPVAFWGSGSGPALLVVHGATADHTTTWRFVLADLQRRFTVHAMDRRGRGGSGDAPDYDLQREAEDVAAIVDAIGGPVHVLGHSYGALVALEASLLTPNVARLVLYEGVAPRPADLYPPGFIEEMEARLAAGDLDGVLTAMYRELVQMPPEEVELLRAQPDAWAARLRNTRALPRELRADAGYVFRPERFGRMRAPALLLVGGESPPRELENARAVAAALPDAQVLVMPGQQHAAMYTAPHLFSRAVLRFLGSAR